MAPLLRTGPRWTIRLAGVWRCGLPHSGADARQSLHASDRRQRARACGGAGVRRRRGRRRFLAAALGRSGSGQDDDLADRRRAGGVERVRRPHLEAGRARGEARLHGPRRRAVEPTRSDRRATGSAGGRTARGADARGAGEGGGRRACGRSRLPRRPPRSRAHAAGARCGRRRAVARSPLRQGIGIRGEAALERAGRVPDRDPAGGARGARVRTGACVAPIRRARRGSARSRRGSLAPAGSPWESSFRGQPCAHCTRRRAAIRSSRSSSPERSRNVQAAHVPGEAPPLPGTLRELLGARLGALPDETRRALLAAAASTEPTLQLVQAATGLDAAKALGPAVATEVVSIGAGRIQFAHPLLAAAADAAAEPAARRDVHARLAGLVRDLEQRARHLALAADGPRRRGRRRPG